MSLYEIKNVAQSEEAFLVFPSGLLRVKRTNLHLRVVLNGVQQYEKCPHCQCCLSGARVQKASLNGMVGGALSDRRSPNSIRCTYMSTSSETHKSMRHLYAQWCASHLKCRAGG